MALSWNTVGFCVDSVPQYLISGEFPYFRVPADDWLRRMHLFREAGGNCIATYVPWIIHEQAEGDIRFGDQPQRDLTRFLRAAKEAGLQVILRPGPYQYSELLYNGLPPWLIEQYPQITAQDASGAPLAEGVVSYLHPLFLEKARAYYRAFAAVVRPFLACAGGPVCMVQVDNEMTGVHSAADGLDFNRQTMGFGNPSGRYPNWLTHRYGGRIEALNKVYQTDYAAFSDVPPPSPDSVAPSDRRRMRDYAAFYVGMLAEYACLLRSWLIEDGITVPFCHNSANPVNNALFKETVAAMGKNFLFGSDHYYNLGPQWAQNSPTPQYALRVLSSCEQLKALGMPPTILELPAGNLADTPPILAEDLFACYMINAALGMKGLNYYIYTGGPNFPGTGTNGEMYDYHAPVSADGTLKPTYQALKAFGLFLRENAWMQCASRVTSVQLGFTWEDSRFHKYAPPECVIAQQEAHHFREEHVLYALMMGRYAPGLTLIDRPINRHQPLIVVTGDCMSEKAQQAIIDFVEGGGQALILPIIPAKDENGDALPLLRDYLHFGVLTEQQKKGRCIRVNGIEEGVFAIRREFTYDLPADALPIAWDERTSAVLGAEIRRGKGRVLWLGVTFNYESFSQAALMETLIHRMAGVSCVQSGNRNILTALWRDETHHLLYLMNPYSGVQQTDITVLTNEAPQTWRNVVLKPMEVKTLMW